MRLNRFLTSETILSKHYLRAFYTLLLPFCFFKAAPSEGHRMISFIPVGRYRPERSKNFLKNSH